MTRDGGVYDRKHIGYMIYWGWEFRGRMELRHVY